MVHKRHLRGGRGWATAEQEQHCGPDLIQGRAQDGRLSNCPLPDAWLVYPQGHQVICPGDRLQGAAQTGVQQAPWSVSLSSHHWHRACEDAHLLGPHEGLQRSFLCSHLLAKLLAKCQVSTKLFVHFFPYVVEGFFKKERIEPKKS